MRLLTEVTGLPPHPQDMIIAFTLAVARAAPHDVPSQCGFNFTTDPKSGEFVVYGYIATDPSQPQLVAVLIGCTEADWNLWGPPASIELSEGEKERRGLPN